MKLIVHELEASPLNQVIVPSRYTIVEAVRPHLVLYNNPTGTLTLSILDDTALVIATSAVVNIADIATLAYFHGYVKFDINAYLAKDREYTLRLSGSGGYSFSESAYVGWVNGHDLAKYPTITVPAGHFHYPLDYEVWERTAK